MPVLESSELTSSDGTRLSFRTLGDGPPLVIAHGVFSTSDDYVPAAVRLASTRRVVLVDRRGYRGSGVGPGPATFAQDGDDLIELMRLLASREHPRCELFGHSAGALAALCAAGCAPALIRSLALFEPPILSAGAASAPLLQRYRELMAAGEDSSALVAFTAASSAVATDAARLWIEPLAPNPHEGRAVGVGRDLEALAAFPPEFEPWRGLDMPVTLLLSGADRDDDITASFHRLATVLPSSRSIVLAEGGVDHVTDPGVLAGALDAAFPPA